MTAQEAQAAITEELMKRRNTVNIRFSCGCLYWYGPEWSIWKEACKLFRQCAINETPRLWGEDTNELILTALEDGDIASVT